MKCTRCDGTGWASAFRDSGLPADTPMYHCTTCDGTGEIGGAMELTPRLRKIVRDAIRKVRRKRKRKASRRDK